MSASFSRRNVLQLSMGAAAISLLSACGAKAETGSAAAPNAKEPVEIKVGYIADYNGAALMAVADQEGYWAKAGLKPKYLPFTNGPLAIQALGTNNVDVAYIGSGALWLPASGKAEIWAVNSVSNADRIIAQPGNKSLADLKGKKIATPFNSTSHFDTIIAIAAPSPTRVWVRKPALFWRISRSRPMQKHRPSVSASRATRSALVNMAHYTYTVLLWVGGSLVRMAVGL